MNIQIEKIEKIFGSTVALSDINLELTKENVYCLLGVNGAGKSTLLNIVSGLLSPSSGNILYDGISYTQIPNRIKYKIGVLSENNPLIEELTPKQYIKLIGKIYKLNRHDIEERMTDLFSYFFETPPPEKPLSTYSTGMKKKIGICASVIHAPDVLLLDEPFTGLDPVSAELMTRFINEYKSKTRLILVSSHEIHLVEKIASQIMVVDKGKLIFNSTFDDFLQDKSSIDQAVMDMLLSEDNNEKSIKKATWI